MKALGVLTLAIGLTILAFLGAGCSSERSTSTPTELPTPTPPDLPEYVFNNTGSMDHDDLIEELAKVSNITSNKLDIQVSTIGYSVLNKSLSLIKIQALPEQEGNIRIMAIARQHGNEPAGTNAVFSYISDLVNDQRRLPGGVTLLVVAMVNPDGANSNTRNNHNNINLNRDWDTRNQPETAAVYELFEQFDPEIFLDLHEFSSFTGRNFDMTYCPGIAGTSPAQLRSLYTAFESLVDQSLAEKSINCDKTKATVVGWVEGDTIFAANHMGIKKYALSYIVESKGIPADNPLPPMADRVLMHRVFLETIIEYADNNKTEIINIISSLREAN